jgi:hypothetical protein
VGLGVVFSQVGIDIDKVAISNFLRIVEHSIFVRNKNVERFIAAICFGNMRMALEMVQLSSVWRNRCRQDGGYL